ncbi:transcriptional repressor TraM (plasmid) [Sinorhizobium garamanticum]|uniref:Transcriptional repressor TraM n=1 Tax=Sinorhizobium garamanticum TaxID=680247 RepID=A0ABY8DN40_9HYPH|nr:transcriptional repressor TraM [Sinorhizobium garamanticum]WEX91407.1 transcriptional repressor TraM [Sinorhizobium garamanticum]
MNDMGSSEVHDESNEKEARYSVMTRSDLEALAVSAICEHRRLLEVDQAVYEEWLRANDDPSISSSELQTLQDEYIARQKISEAQQEELSEILDALGFIPVVPFKDDN